MTGEYTQHRVYRPKEDSTQGIPAVTGQEMDESEVYANIGNGMTRTDIDRTLSKGQNRM